MRASSWISALAIIITLITIACGTNGSHLASPLAPSQSVQAVVYDSSVQWDKDQIGKVTVTNPKMIPLTLTFMLWDYKGEFNQISIAAAVYTILPGATQILTVGTQSNACKVQRDLYEGVHKVGDTLNDLSNVLYAGGGVHDTGCKPVVVTPPPSFVPPPVVPPSKCEDPKATNKGGPLPCTYNPCDTLKVSTLPTHPVPPCEVEPPCKPTYGNKGKGHDKPKPCYKK